MVCGDGRRSGEGVAREAAFDRLINAGFFVFERGVLDYLQGDDSVDLEKETFARLAKENR